MTLLEEVEKLMEEGYKDSEKDEEKMLEVRRFYAKKHNWQTNYARLAYECMFNLSCREAEELNIDLWVHLSNKFKIPEEERYLTRPPDTLKDKKKRQDCIKWLFYPFFFEWQLNNYANPIIYAFSKDLLTLREGGNKTVATTKPRSAARKAPLIKERKKLIDDGVTNERVILKLVAKVFPDEHYHYIRQTILAEKKKEADERRLARTGF